MFTVFTIQPAKHDDPNDRDNVVMEAVYGYDNAYQAFADTLNDLYDVGATIDVRHGGYATAVFPKYPNEIGKIGIIPTHWLN